MQGEARRFYFVPARLSFVCCRGENFKIDLQPRTSDSALKRTNALLSAAKQHSAHTGKSQSRHLR